MRRGQKKDAGYELTFSEYPDMVDVWHLLRAMTPEGGRAIDEAGTFIRAHTASAAAGRARSGVNVATCPWW